jgi:lipopolysaccharide biosynthesis regulator YciM
MDICQKCGWEMVDWHCSPCDWGDFNPISQFSRFKRLIKKVIRQ